MTDKFVLVEKIPGNGGEIGLITLDRPNALNSLNEKMCKDIYDTIMTWNDEARMKAIILKGAGDRAFCAGGDVRKIYELRDKTLAEKQSFFYHEYRLDHAIAHCKKPVIAILNGITMGGGVGISWPAMFRVATEKLMFAMPETTIGFYPDVGGGYFLSRCEPLYGKYLALTGAHIGVAEASLINFVTHYVSSEDIDEIVQKLIDTLFAANDPKRIADIINPYVKIPERMSLLPHITLLKESFNHNKIEDIIKTLEKSHDEEVRKISSVLKAKSPISLKIVLEQLKRYEKLNYDESLQMDYRITTHFLQNNDFYEGVRALLVDKDKNPRWIPEELSQVTDKLVASYFSSVDSELKF